MIFKRLISMLFAIALILIFTIMAFAKEYEVPLDENGTPVISSAHAIVYNIETGKTLFSKDADTIVYPASLVKIMSGIIACEYYDTKGADFEVIVSENAIEGVQGNKINLKAGEKVSFYNLLCAMLVGGSNDAAYVIGETVAGSVDAFVDMMNEKAKEIGALDTTYKNPGGFHSPRMLTTTRDQALISAYAFRNKTLMDITSMADYTVPETNMSKKRVLTNQNILHDPEHWLRLYTPGIKGLNAGMTTEAGYCLSTVYDNDGMSNVVIVMGGEIEGFDYHYMKDVKALIEYSSTAFTYKTIVSKDTPIADVKVSEGKDTDMLLLTTDREISALVDNRLDLSKVEHTYKLNSDELTAPIEKGEVLGNVIYTLEGEEIGRVDLVASTTIERDLLLWMWGGVVSFFELDSIKSTALFIVSLLCLAFVIFLFRYYVIGKRKRIEARKREHANSKVRRKI